MVRIEITITWEDGAEMRKTLVDVLFMSEKRKNVLLLLQEGPKVTQSILDKLKTTRTALLPQMRVLEESFLVIHYDDTYGLTKTGELIVNEMKSLLDIIDVLDVDIEYWGTHKLDFIPPHLLARINELGRCRVVSPSITEIFEVDSEFHESSKRSRSLFKVTTFLYPNYPMLFSELIPSNVELNLIITDELLDKIRTDNDPGFRELSKTGLIKISIYPDEMGFLSFAYNDHQLLLNPIKIDGDFDKKHILTDNPGALEWGKELFNHYLKDAVPVTEI